MMSTANIDFPVGIASSEENRLWRKKLAEFEQQSLESHLQSLGVYGAATLNSLRYD